VSKELKSLEALLVLMGQHKVAEVVLGDVKVTMSPAAYEVGVQHQVPLPEGDDLMPPDDKLMYASGLEEVPEEDVEEPLIPNPFEKAQ
jgi:hypothetical protein